MISTTTRMSTNNSNKLDIISSINRGIMDNKIMGDKTSLRATKINTMILKIKMSQIGVIMTNKIREDIKTTEIKCQIMVRTKVTITRSIQMILIKVTREIRKDIIKDKTTTSMINKSKVKCTLASTRNNVKSKDLTMVRIEMVQAFTMKVNNMEGRIIINTNIIM